MLELEYKKRSPWGKIITFLIIILAIVVYLWLTSQETQAPTYNESSGVEFDINKKNNNEASRIQRSEYNKSTSTNNIIDTDLPIDTTATSSNDAVDDILLEDPVSELISDESETQMISGNITVNEPVPNTTVTSPITITGEAQLADNIATVRITNEEGIALISETVRVQATSGEKGPFKIIIYYQFSNTKEGFIEVGDGVDIVRVPVTFE